MKGVAWFLWIGGLIISVIVSVRTTYTSDYHPTETFDFGTFLLSASLYFFAGAFAMCWAELMQNIAAIKNALCKQKDTNGK